MDVNPPTLRDDPRGIAVDAMIRAVLGRQPIRRRDGSSPAWVWSSEAMLRGIGQVDFQNNWLSGLVILGAVFYSSRVCGVACVVGVATATLTALVLGADRTLVGAGLFQLNGALMGIGLVTYLSPNAVAWPGWRLWLFVVFGAALTAVITAALMAVGERVGMPTLTWPFNLAAWLFLFAAPKFAGLPLGPGLRAGLPAGLHGLAGPYDWATVYRGVGNGIAEVFFQDSWVCGYLILGGIALSSVIGAGMALTGALLGVGTAMALGAEEAIISAGLFSYNSVLTAIALGGVFYLLTARGVLLALFATITTTWVWAAVTIAFQPAGMPALTGPFCIVATLAILAKWRLTRLTPVPPGEAGTPEENLARHRRGPNSTAC